MTKVDVQAVFEAVKSNQVEVIEHMMQTGCDPNLKDGNSNLLHIAVRCGHLKIVELLLEHGAKVDLEDDFGKTPLEHSRDYQFLEIEEVLRKHGAN